MLQGQPKKVGLRLPGNRLRSMAERNILATRKIDNVPSTVFMGPD